LGGGASGSSEKGKKVGKPKKQSKAGRHQKKGGGIGPVFQRGPGKKTRKKGKKSFGAKQFGWCREKLTTPKGHYQKREAKRLWPGVARRKRGKEKYTRGPKTGDGGRRHPGK